MGSDWKPQVAHARAMQRNRCYWCGRRFRGDCLPTRDHLLPLQAGGTNETANIVASCEPCGNARSNPKLGRARGKIDGRAHQPEVVIPRFALDEAARRGFPLAPKPGVVVTVVGCGRPRQNRGPCLQDAEHDGPCAPPEDLLHQVSYAGRQMRIPARTHGAAPARWASVGRARHP